MGLREISYAICISYFSQVPYFCKTFLTCSSEIFNLAGKWVFPKPLFLKKSGDFPKIAGKTFYGVVFQECNIKHINFVILDINPKGTDN